MMTALRRLHLRAARLLEARADELYQSCVGRTDSELGPAWCCSDCSGVRCSAQRDHDSMVKTAAQLRGVKS